MSGQQLLQWLRTADAPVPTRVRAARRRIAQADARRRSGSISAFLDDTVRVGDSPAVQPHAFRSRGRSRIVALSTYPLSPRASGGQLRGFHLAHALARRAGVDVTILSVSNQATARAVERHADGVVEYVFPLPGDLARRETAMRLVAAPVSLTDIASALMWEAIPELVWELGEQLDGAAATLLVQPYLAAAALRIAPDIPLVCDAHNDEFALKSEIYPDDEGGHWLLRHIEATERLAVESAATVTATTDHDLESLSRRYQVAGHTAVVPNGVDTASVAFVTGAARARRRLALGDAVDIPAGRAAALFVGAGHRPNVDAGRAILAMAEQLPDVTFLLAGAHSRALDRPRLPSNVVLLGVVSAERLDLLLTSCDLALNPMATGSGSNLKLLMYLAAGLPIVSTDIGARGVDADEAGIAIASLDRFPDAIVAALGRPDADRVAAGRRWVEQHGDWTAIGQRFAEIVVDRTLP